MSLKHGVWISALPGGVEGGAVTISRGEKQMSLGQWRNRNGFEWAELACLMGVSCLLISWTD